MRPHDLQQPIGAGRIANRRNPGGLPAWLKRVIDGQ
jgi:hypothetical protein